MDNAQENSDRDQHGPGGGEGGGGREAAPPPGPGEVASMGKSVTPHALFSEGDYDIADFKLVCAGIDTLDLGFYVRWNSDAWHQKLERLRSDAAGTNGVQAPDGPYLVHPGGKPPMYRFHLEYPDGHVFVTGKPELKNFPNVYVSIGAHSLWLNGTLRAVDYFHQEINRLGGIIESIAPSRVDLAADFLVKGGFTLDFLRKRLVTKARSTRLYLKEDALQTYYLGDGSSPIQMRIYHKSAEIIQSDKTFFLGVWRDKLKLGEFEHVWRVEGQFRREVLREFGIGSLTQLLGNLNPLWDYLTDWTSLRCLDDPNPSRRSIHPLWVTVQAAGGVLGDPGTLTRKIDSDSTAPVDWYVQHIAGCLVGFAARLNILDLSEAITALFDHMTVKMSPAAFTARVQAELIRLGQYPGEVADGSEQ